ncbi:MAG: glycerol-3-phosphate 1-O-acyltransferase PlsY [Magnetococcales bacterium]|nr:glycerol-3-phosphate 1-O-acyltransferase PlsY [Magnetococcales bacterium]
MNPLAEFAPHAIVVIAYLLGSIPFGLVLARLVGGVDIRNQGSGNIGATNVLRSVGKKIGALALILDMIKGTIPVVVALFLFEPPSIIPALTGLAAFLGHLFPLYLKFKGGKGVATGLGIFFALSPITGGVAVVAWLGSAVIFRFSSASSLAAFAVMPITLTVLGDTNALMVSAVTTPLVFWRHRPNIKRLLEGTEPRIGKKGPPP